MSIRAPVTGLLGISHPILLAPMDLVADAHLTAAVSAAGGLGILGGGHGDEFTRHLDEESTKYTAASRNDDFDVAAVVAGETSGLVRELCSARDVVNRIVREASKLLAHGPGFAREIPIGGNPALDVIRQPWSLAPPLWAD